MKNKLNISFIFSFLLIWIIGAKAQKSILKADLAFGKYTVGFQSYNLYDHSRSFSVDENGNALRVGQKRSRPIQMCVWYPARPENKTPLKYEDYFVLKAHEVGEVSEFDKETLIKNFIENEQVDKSRLLQELNVEMRAIKDANPETSQKFPVVIYGPSWWSTAFENALLFEFLASHGYVIVSSPSVGPESREMPISRIGVETQARDMEFLLAQTHEFPNADMDKIAVAGFSLGGLSNVLMMARNKTIDAWIGMDPSIHEAYEFFSESPYEDYSRFTKPSLFINTVGYMNALPFYDKLIYSDAFMVNLPKIEHTDLASQFVKLYGNPEDLESVNKKTRAYKMVSKYILTFLNNVLYSNSDFEELRQNVFASSTVDTSFVQTRSKKGLPSVDKIVLKNNPQDIISLLNTTLNSNGISNFPVTDLQKLIFLASEKEELEKVSHLMRWYQSNYEDTFHEKVLVHIGFEEMLKKFPLLYKDNQGCQFTYDEVNHTAHLLSMSGKGEEALDYFILNTKLNPESPKAFFNLGIGYYRMKDLANAKPNFEKCLELGPDSRYKNMAEDLIKECK
ncbi:hypothetical protein [Flagellimonas nanhaiensis]|uniref:Uncharacterized protein n=1 Tax=Flagellimonas nanhaiensis TaxID=2292706 RepID=A0A371JRB9_9FLAO|nr:hypothetical protein [Allomuricauda nanhaiensis]RDY60045.1 hypothetical protein DX873_11940 [Allomuricauda nanhaiensis]